MPKKGTQLHDRHREAIKVGMCLEFLHSVVATGKTPEGKDPTPAQLAAAKELLSKALPALQAQEITSNVTHDYVIEVPEQITPEDWEKKAGAVTPASKLN